MMKMVTMLLALHESDWIGSSAVLFPTDRSSGSKLGLESELKARTSGGTKAKSQEPGARSQ